jgi:hypothetical protein
MFISSWRSPCCSLLIRKARAALGIPDESEQIPFRCFPWFLAAAFIQNRAGRALSFTSAFTASSTRPSSSFRFFFSGSMPAFSPGSRKRKPFLPRVRTASYLLSSILRSFAVLRALGQHHGFLTTGHPDGYFTAFQGHNVLAGMSLNFKILQPGD